MADKPTPKEMDDLFVEETGFDTDDFPAAIFDFARAVLAKWGKPAQAAEPVAWLDPWTGTKVTTDYDAYGKHGIPLVRQQPVAREQLTPERVKEIVRGAGYDQCGIPDTERAAFINGLRHGEQAHGIKVGQHGDAKP